MKIRKLTLKLLSLFYIVLVVNSNHAAFSTASNYKIKTKKHKTTEESADPDAKLTPTPPTAATPSIATPTMTKPAMSSSQILIPQGAPTVITPMGSNLQLSSKDDLPDLPIYFQGWVKYFKYMDQQTVDRPKTFFKNTQYSTQTPTTEKDEVRIT
jgi:hypothetical protein